MFADTELLFWSIYGYIVSVAGQIFVNEFNFQKNELKAIHVLEIDTNLRTFSAIGNRITQNGSLLRFGARD